MIGYSIYILAFIGGVATFGLIGDGIASALRFIARVQRTNEEVKTINSRVLHLELMVGQKRGKR